MERRTFAARSGGRSRARRPDTALTPPRPAPAPAPAIRRGHLQLVAPSPVPAPPAASPAPAGPSARERRTMTRVAALLRRRAARLPEDSLLRAELLETAEDYATGAEEAFAEPAPAQPRDAQARAC